MSDPEITIRPNFQLVPQDYLPKNRRSRPIYGLRWWVNVPYTDEDCDWVTHWASLPVLTVAGMQGATIRDGDDPLEKIVFRDWCGQYQFRAFRDWMDTAVNWTDGHITAFWKWSPTTFSPAEHISMAAMENMLPMICVVTPKWLRSLESQFGDRIEGTFANWTGA